MQNKKFKPVQIKSDIHTMLKEYCDIRGLKLAWFLEQLITEKCGPGVKLKKPAESTGSKLRVN